VGGCGPAPRQLRADIRAVFDAGSWTDLSPIHGIPVTYEEAGAFLLGIEAAALAKPNSLAVVRRFVETLSDEYAKPISQILAEEGRLVDSDARRGVLYRRFQVFGAGIFQTQGR
jgi:hypothetical protein